MPLDSDIRSRLDFAQEIARAAGEITLRYFRRDDLQVERKADESPVTVADRQAEELLRERIMARFPEDAILGEELGSREGKSGYQWILDPIDGTKSFIHSVPLYSTLIAILEDGEPRMGVINAPATGEMVYAASGGGCWYSPSPTATARRARVSSVERLQEGLLLTSEIEGFKKRQPPGSIEAFLRLQSKARVSRTWGDGYGYLMVATGRAEVMIDPNMKLWDAAPLQTIIEEAGGRFTDWQGNPTIHAGEAIATNGHVADEVLKLVAGVTSKA